jgi:hypothetical protein
MEAYQKDSITIKDRYVRMLSSFDSDVQSAVDLALQRYLIDQVTARIASLKRKDRAFQTKYGCDYETFSRRTAEDEGYVKEVEQTINRMWEADQADWEFCHKGIEDWTRQLQRILTMS